MTKVRERASIAAPRKRGRKPVDPDETPAIRFKRLAAARTNKILESLKVLENCSNRAYYSYSDYQVKKIVRALTRGVEGVRAAFADNRPSPKDSFEVRAPRPRSSVHDERTPRQRYLDRNKQGRRFAQRRLGVGPR